MSAHCHPAAPALILQPSADASATFDFLCSDMRHNIEMPDNKSQSATGRMPQRSNGFKRREAILDAATAIISETGIASVTLHATARRAGASVGSMYHFFRDKDQLLDALRERHRQTLMDMVAWMKETSPADWQAMSSKDVIEMLFGKPVRYYADQSFALDLHQLKEEQAADAFLSLVMSVMTLRLGEIRGPLVARMLYAISTGTLSFLLDGKDAARLAMIADIPSVLAAYLANEEARCD